MGTNDMLERKQDIYNALEQLMVLFVKNNEYGDVDGLLDDTPFMPLFISLKKSVYESLLNLAMQNKEITAKKLAALQRETQLEWNGTSFSFPDLTVFAAEEGKLRFCNFDLEKFQIYLSAIEDALLPDEREENSTSFANTIGLIYSRMSCEGGVSIADTIRQNKIEHEKKNLEENRNEFDQDVATDCLSYAIHWEDDNNYWCIDIWSYVYGTTLYYFENQEMYEEYGHMLTEAEDMERLFAMGILKCKDIEIKIPCVLEEISRAFYESKCVFEHGFVLGDCEDINTTIELNLADSADIKTGRVKESEAGDIGHMYLLETLVHPKEVERLSTEQRMFKEKMEAKGCIFVNEMVKDARPSPKDKQRPIGKGMFKQLLSPKDEGQMLSREGKRILLGYMLYLETVLEVLKMPNFQIPGEIIEKIVEDVAFRVEKVALLNAINFYTRKSKGKLKKSDLQAMVTPRSRWRRCSDYYSDERFSDEDLNKFSDYLGVVIG